MKQMSGNRLEDYSLGELFLDEFGITEKTKGGMVANSLKNKFIIMKHTKLCIQA